MSPSFGSKIVRMNEVPFDDVQVDGRSNSPIVMVVDDEKLVADTLSLILAKAGFSTRTAYDGASALRMAQNHVPTLLISDVAMPGMSGIELAAAMTAACPKCKVLFFSGHVTSLKLAELLGADHKYELLTKPVHPTEMLKHVSRMLQVPELPGMPIGIAEVVSMRLSA